jgi:hypothetical protein
VASKLVGLFPRSPMRRSTTMIEGQRMTVADVVAQVGDGSYTQKLWMGLKKEAAYLPG